MGKVLVITTSLRAKSNSDILAGRLAAGARDAGHDVELVSLKGKDIRFCIGCLSCQKTQQCVLRDDAAAIAEKVKAADTLVFATPVYYYGMSGQMKTLLDRLNPLYPSDYRFRRAYLLTTAAEDEASVPERAVDGLQGWIACFPKARLAGSLFCGGVTGPGESEENDGQMEKAYAFGRSLE
jgi:multimeric flavodoxin WrbA